MSTVPLCVQLITLYFISASSFWF